MIEIKDLSKTFSSASGTVEALRDINLTINDGEIFGIIGLSGAGKSTLVRCINLLERPTSGQVIIDGKDMTALPRKELLKMRRSISMIFQGFNLLEQRSVLRNVCFPLEMSGTKSSEAKKRALELLKLVGLENKANAYPAQLSGGQKQRVAIARALATNPRYLLCDEATSALDPNTTRSILELLREINQSLGVTIIVITHEMKVIDQICDRVAVIDQSRIAEEGKVSDVFTNPRSEIARELIIPQDRAALDTTGGKKLRLIFNGFQRHGLQRLPGGRGEERAFDGTRDRRRGNARRRRDRAHLRDGFGDACRGRRDVRDGRLRPARPGGHLRRRGLEEGLSHGDADVRRRRGVEVGGL